jgi:hypothetical protein
MALPGVTVDQLDSEMSAAQSAVAKLGGFLFELDTARQQQAPDASRLIGISATRWSEAGDQLSVLWSWYQATSQVLTELADQRKASRLRPDDVDAMWDRLTGTSIELPPDSLAAARRCLPDVTGIGSRASITAVLDGLAAGYERAAETVTALATVRELALPALDELRQELRAVEDRARLANVRVPNEATRLGEAIDQLGSQVATDPLAADVSTIPSLRAALQEVQSAVEKTAQAAATVGADFEHLGRELGYAAADITSAAELAATVAEKIAGQAGQIEQSARLEKELAELRSELAEAKGRVADDRVAASRQARELGSRLLALRSDAASLQRSAATELSRRQELRGRLGAYQAKASALGRAEDYSLEQLYRSAEEALYSAPCDLEAAERRVAAYQTAILKPPGEDRLS